MIVNYDRKNFTGQATDLTREFGDSPNRASLLWYIIDYGCKKGYITGLAANVAKNYTRN
jgi:hypothetical protein